MFEDFKKFAMKGSVIDLAVGVITGTAFGKIVTSLVNDIIMPPIGVLLGGINFSSLAIVIKAASENSKAVTINYGSFINTIIDFVIISFSVFFMIRQLSKVKITDMSKKDSDEVKILKEIRDELKKRK